MYGGTDVGANLQTHNDTGRLPAVTAVAAAVEVLGTADSVIEILAGIPECTNEAWNTSAVVGANTFYRIDANGDLQMSRHNVNGFDMVLQTIGWGWDVATKVFAADGGAVYAIQQDGGLWIFEHDSAGDWYNWGTQIGTGWGHFTDVWAGRFGEIYAIDQDGLLRLYKHDGDFAWENPVGTVIGWDWTGFAKVFGGGHGAIYLIQENGDLLYYYHDESYQWQAQAVLLGTGWNSFVEVGSTGSGEVYGLTIDGKLLFHRHDGTGAWVEGSGGIVGTHWNFGDWGMIPAQY